MQTSVVNPPFNSINSAIADFLDSYPCSEDVKHRLWELLIAAMGSEHSDMWNRKARADMLFFYEQICNFMDAFYAKQGDIEYSPFLSQ